MKEIIIPIKGMHCRSCEIILADNLEQVPGIKKAEVSLARKEARIIADYMLPKSAIKYAIEKGGYKIGIDKKPWFSRNLSDYKDVFIGIVLITLIALLLNRLGIADINTGSVASGGLIVALLVGLTAGFSTCMALVGGLVLGISAKYAEKHPGSTPLQKFRPHLYFNAGRIVSFFILGGVIGALGSVFQLQGSMLGIVTIVVGLVMLVIGLQLTSLFPRVSGGGITLPSSFARVLGIGAGNNKEYSAKNSVVLGAASFFLPCGFTQAMQIYAISTGSFMTGALLMGLFAIGTSPGLLGIGGLSSIFEGRAAKRFFKVAGVAVVALALVNITNGYSLTGLPQPFAKPPVPSRQVEQTLLTGEVDEALPADRSASENILQAKYTLATGMVPSSFNVKPEQSYTLKVDALEDGVGCMSTIFIPGLNNDLQTILKGKTNVLPFKAPKSGTYQITCGMGVPHGTINVKPGA